MQTIRGSLQPLQIPFLKSDGFRARWFRENADSLELHIGSSRRGGNRGFNGKTLNHASAIASSTAADREGDHNQEAGEGCRRSWFHGSSPSWSSCKPYPIGSLRYAMRLTPAGLPPEDSWPVRSDHQLQLSSSCFVLLRVLGRQGQNVCLSEGILEGSRAIKETRTKCREWKTTPCGYRPTRDSCLRGAG